MADVVGAREARRLSPRYGLGWDGVARAIVFDLGHLLPPRTASCRGLISSIDQYR